MIEIKVDDKSHTPTTLAMGTLSQLQLLDLNRMLVDLIVKLKSGEVEVIEYGEPSNPGGIMSYLRIRYMTTAGGKQFSLHVLNSLGQQGSGFYSPDPADILVLATQQVIHYHRQTHFPVKSRSNLMWFAFTEGDQRVMGHVQGRDLGLLGTVVSMTEPNVATGAL